MAEKIKQLNSDHDLLIRIDAKVQNLIESFEKFFDSQDGKNRNHETRILTIEETLSKFEPVEMKRIINENKQQIRDYKLTWKIILGLSSAIGGVVGFILSQLSSIIELISKTH